MTSRTEVVIVINPGSTSTKFALRSREGSVSEHTVRHDPAKLAARAVDQLDYRRDLMDQEIDPLVGDYQIVAVVGRGGLFGPMEGGTYRVSEAMIQFLRRPDTTNHASNLGAMLADHYARKFNVGAFIVDPVTVDEFESVARFTGVTWCTRKSRAHALNIKYTVRRAASELGKPIADTRFVVAHLGGGISIAAVKGGRIIDSNDAMHGMGPFSPERAGALPIGPLVEKCFSPGTEKKQLLDELARKSGLTAYCGTSDVVEILRRREERDASARDALQAMIYQIGKEIGAMATVLQGKLDSVLITGGVAHSAEVVAELCERIQFLGKVMVLPGEGELEALADGAFRVIDGLEEAKLYLAN